MGGPRSASASARQAILSNLFRIAFAKAE